MQFAIEQGPQRFDWRGRRYDGELFWAEVSLRATSIAGNVRIIASIHDIDERKRAVKELEKNERRLSFAISATADAIWEINLQSMEASIALVGILCSATKTNKLPMTHETFSLLCHPEDRQPLMESLKAVSDSRHSGGFEAEYRMRRADGTWCWLLGRGNVVSRDTDGRALLVSGTNTDVTERKRAEKYWQRGNIASD